MEIGEIIENTLKVMRTIDKQSIPIAKDAFYEFVDGDKEKFVKLSSAIFNFSKKGPQFLETVLSEKGDINPRIQLAIDKKKSENIDLKKNQELRKKISKKIPDWIEQGNELIYPEKREKWKKLAKCGPYSKYNGEELDKALEIMKLIDKKDFKGKIHEDNLAHAKEILHRPDGKLSYDAVRKIVLQYSKNGPEFFRATALQEIDEKTYMHIEKIERENYEFEKSSKEKEINLEDELSDGLEI